MENGYIVTKGDRKAPPLSQLELRTKTPREFLSSSSLCRDLPRFDSKHTNRIIWYQYLLFVSRFKTPFYVTYPAEWCWDIEGQWLKFQEHYAINPAEAEKVDSRFSIGDPGLRSNNHNMIGDLLSMNVTDSNTGLKYEFKRTHKLIGTLVAHGFIEFERYYDSSEREIFIYDRSTGYHVSIGEDECKIGDRMVFNAWWNKDDNDSYHYDVSEMIEDGLQDDGDTFVHFELFAFDVKPASVKEIISIMGLTKEHRPAHASLPNKWNGINGMDCSMGSTASQSSVFNYSVPALADEFAGRRFEGLLIALTKEDTGLVVCFPFSDKPNTPLTVLLAIKFVQSADRKQLCVNTCLSFAIGINPFQGGKGVCGYVAIDIVICGDGFSCAHPMMPITIPCVCRAYRGHIVVKNKYVYNETDNNMAVLDGLDDYSVGKYLRYNESRHNKFYMVATDVIAVEKLDVDMVRECHTKDGFIKYNANRYILNSKLRIDRTRIIQYKYVDVVTTQHTDLYLIVEQCEMYLNAILNTNRGGAVMFGIQDDGRIIGQKSLTKAKRDYIRHSIMHRVKYFTPAVPNKYYCIKFKPVIDTDGFAVVDTYVVVIDVVMLHNHHIKFATSSNVIFEIHNGQLMTISGKSHLNSKDVVYSVNPRFVALCDDDDDAYDDDEVDINDEHEDYQDYDCVSYSVDTVSRYNESVHTVSDINDKHVVQYTTPSLNSNPIPPNTERGRLILAERVQIKINEMMNVNEYMLDPRWQSILTMAASPLYNAQKTTWMLMKNLEKDKIMQMKKMAKQMKNMDENKSDQDEAAPLPILPDKSKYKAVIMEYCQKTGWKRPIEATQPKDKGFKASVIFGSPGKETTAFGEGTTQKNAIYAAYMQLIPLVIPEKSAKELMEKWITYPHKKQAEIQIIKHPKSVLLEWAQKNNIAPPKTTFNEFVDPSRNIRLWTSKVTFCNKTVEAQGAKKKDAQSKCFKELLNHIMDIGDEKIN